MDACLQRTAGCGDALLHSIAYSPPKLQHVDMTQLRSRCATEHGMVPNGASTCFCKPRSGKMRVTLTVAMCLVYGSVATPWQRLVYS